MSEHSVDHHTFAIERRLKASPDRVFHAWASPDAKRRWATCDPGTVNVGFSLDFRPYGSETNRVVTPDGRVHLLQALYLDIVADRRIVYAYDIHVDDVRVSASLAIVVFEPARGGTRMVFTEQIALLAGRLDLEERIHGTGELFDLLAHALADEVGANRA